MSPRCHYHDAGMQMKNFELLISAAPSLPINVSITVSIIHRILFLLAILERTGTKLYVNTNPYTVTGLSPSTAYDFYVSDSCGVGSISDSIGPYQFIAIQLKQ